MSHYNFSCIMPSVEIEQRILGQCINTVAVAKRQIANQQKAEARANSMPVDIYFLPHSAPCRAVMMTAKAVGIELNMKICDITNPDNLSPEFLKMNPQHTIPTMDDKGLVVWESRPIMAYLVDSYASSDSLYPRCPKQRVVVDQRLYFDMGTIYQRLAQYYFPVILKGVPLDPEKLAALNEAVEWFNTILTGKRFAAGDHLTIADISLVVSFSTMEAFDYDVSPFPNVASWFARIKRAMAPYGYEEINQAGANMLGGAFKKSLESQ